MIPAAHPMAAKGEPMNHLSDPDPDKATPPGEDVGSDESENEKVETLEH